MVKKATKKNNDAMKTRMIAAGEFKAKCLQLMDEVKHSKTRLVVTKRGDPYASVVPYTEPKPKLFRSVIGRTPNVEIKGDIISSLPQDMTLPSESWD